jgi:putative ABC transport system permease protein
MGEIKPSPPRPFLNFFRWYCHPRLADHIEGDLIEVYLKRVKKNGKRKADVRFMIDVILLFRPGIVRPAKGYKNLNTYGMYKSYFKIGWRNLLKNKGYSFINIGGLAMGMAVAMLISLWIYDELEFNKYHTNYNGIARVMRNIDVNGETISTAILPNALGDELRTKYGDHFNHVVMAALQGDHIISVGEKKLSLRGVFIERAGPEMFTLNMLQGSRSGLNDPHSILISQSAASALFGNDDPMGKLLKIDNSDRMDVKVTGVYEDLPHNTDFHDMKFYAPFELAYSANQWMQDVRFTNDFLNIYVQINDNTSFESASAQIQNAILNNVREDRLRGR